tara:strand:+ start:40 stop:189 length:150 start_codon:yes stop_codon:yes gene_type:complete
MIEKLKNFICKLFGIKQCACVPVYENEETAKQKKIRLKHKADTDIIGEQ